MAREDVRKKWEVRVAAFRASGEKATRWCKANQVDRRQLYAWMKRIDGTDAPTSLSGATTWLNVQLTPEAEKRNSPCLTVKIGSSVIEVQDGFNPVLLREVVQALQPLC